jgi:predicted Zn-dependent protease
VVAKDDMLSAAQIGDGGDGLLRTWLARLALLCVCAAFAVLPSTDAEARPQRQGAARAPLVTVTGLGNIEPAELRGACRSLLSTLPVRCEVRGEEPIQDYRNAWDREREQMDARALLETMFHRRTVDAHVELLVTDFDIYEGERPFVFGLGSLTDRVAVISTARIAEDFDAFEARFEKLVRHEVGHTLGLPHHDSNECVMRSDPTVESLDTAPERLCQSCRMRFASHAKALSRPGQRALDHARGLLVRGDLEAARGEAQDVLERTSDARVLHELGSSFLQAGAHDDAIRILRAALRGTTELPEAHLGMGIALQRRGQAQDLSQAIRHFERAIVLRPQWRRFEMHVRELKRLRSHMASAQGPRAPHPAGH